MTDSAVPSPPRGERAGVAVREDPRPFGQVREQLRPVPADVGAHAGVFLVDRPGLGE